MEGEGNEMAFRVSCIVAYASANREMLNNSIECRPKRLLESLKSQKLLDYLSDRNGGVETPKQCNDVPRNGRLATGLES